MPLDYSLHEIGTPVQGQQPPAPVLPGFGGQVSLADNTLSAQIDVTVPSVVFVTSTARSRLALTALADVAGIDPATSAIVLEALQLRPFTLWPGSYKLKHLEI
jgi:hypothetical protein